MNDLLLFEVTGSYNYYYILLLGGIPLKDDREISMLE